MGIQRMDERRKLRAKRTRLNRKKRIRKRIVILEACVLLAIVTALAAVVLKEKQSHESGQKQSVSEKEYGQEKQPPKDDKVTGQEASDGNGLKGQPENVLDEAEKAGVPEEAVPKEESAPEEMEDGQMQLPEGAVALENDGDGELVLAFGGDICFHDEYSNMYAYRQKGSDIANCISADLLSEMRDADVFMVNNEFTYTNRGEPIPEKAFTFRSKPENVGILSDMGVDIVSLANNHAFDYGEISLLDTLDTLDAADMPYVGAGRNLGEASKSVIFSKNGISVAFLSATQIERQDNPDTRGATEENAGVFRCWGGKVSDLTAAVASAKETADYVVVYIHWGTENTDELDWAQLDQAKLIAQAGADLIIGDHSHCLQQFANVGGVPVIYSLGNFWFNSRTLDTGLVKVTLTEDGIKSYQFLPAIQENCTTTLAGGSEKERILSYMREISEGVAIDADGYVSFK